ncbi:MAG TPA: GSU2403 family nucleotidyltransferase fold protein [Thermoanaerobaculia bacterium]
MAYQRLPETTQTLYAELLEQTVHAEAEAAALGVLPGTFISKAIKGGTYWYLQRMEGDRKRQHYLGRESRELLSWVEQVKQARALTARDDAQRANLVRMLIAGEAATESAAVVKVLTLLAESGVFRRGGVLVGTQAFSVYGNMLGVRFEQQSLRTQDVDIAQDRSIGIALAQDEEPVNVEESLRASGLGFFPVPALDHRLPSTSFKIRGRELRVDFLTPMFGPESSKPVFLPALGVSAHPLRFLDYLIENPAQGVVVGGSGILVNVPDPARFALHKLWISGKRPVSEQAKAAKDRRQAGDVLEVLLEDRPQDVTAAWEALGNRPALREGARRVFQRLSQDLQERMPQILP